MKKYDLLIPFNKPLCVGTELNHVTEAIKNRVLSGDGPFTEKCHKWFEEKLQCKEALLTTSCTHALEMAAILLDIQQGDEIIMPSYTFVSTANAFVLRGAKIIFIDVRPDTMNIDERLIEAAITEKTKVIVPVHYAGVACEMDSIMKIAEKYGLFVVEDAAQGMMSDYKGQPLGCIGHFGTFSFHETKNFTSGGEGGLLIINDERFLDRAKIIREKGTNRTLFHRGMIDKYSWIDVGSSYLPSELNAAYLWGQLKVAELINNERLKLWRAYFDGLSGLAEEGKIGLPSIPDECRHNAHMFYIKVKDLNERAALLHYLKEANILAVFHYVPLHSSEGGMRFGKFFGQDRFTTIESDRLMRLPLYYGLKKEEVHIVCIKIKQFFLIEKTCNKEIKS